MNRVTVLVAVEPRLLREALQDGLERVAGIAVVSETCDPVEVLATAARFQASVVILTSPEHVGTPPLATHLFAEFPSIVVVSVCPDSGRIHIFRQIVTSQSLPLESIERIVEAIRGEDPEAFHLRSAGACPQ